MKGIICLTFKNNHERRVQFRWSLFRKKYFTDDVIMNIF